MGFDTTVVKILIIVIPGIITLKILSILRNRKYKDIWNDILNIVIFSFLNYFLAVIALNIKIIIKTDVELCLTTLITMPKNFEAIFFDTQIDLSELFIASSFGILLSFIMSYIDYNNLISLIGKKVKVTNTIGYKTIWDNFQNLNSFDWVIVRDFDNNILYRGHISSFSDNEEKKEIILIDVIIYNNKTCELLDEKPAIYLELENKNYVIEVEQLFYQLPVLIDEELFNKMKIEISKLGIKKKEINKIIINLENQYIYSENEYHLNIGPDIFNKKEKIRIIDIYNKLYKGRGE